MKDITTEEAKEILKSIDYGDDIQIGKAIKKS